MANFTVRMIAKQKARGFYKWYDVFDIENKRRRFIRKTLLYWYRKPLGMAHRKWAEASFQIREKELSDELDRQENKRKDLQRQREKEEKEHAAEAAALEKQVQEHNALKD